MEATDMKKMIEMKEKAYLELLEEKSKLEATQKDLQEIIETVEELEKVCGEDELTEELERKKKAIKQAKDIAVSFEKINQELEGYEDNHIREQIQFLHDNQKLHQLRADLKEVEYMSNDLTQKYGLTNTVEVLNPEGKTKRVHADFVKEYEMYVKRIKALSSTKLLNDYAKIEGYAFAPIKANKPTNEAQKTLINDADNIELHEEQEQTLSADERIRNTEIRIQEIINSRYLPKHGKICVVTYNGKKIEIPRSQRGNFAKLIGDLRKYNKEKAELTNTVDNKKYELMIPEEVVETKNESKEELPHVEGEIVPITEVKNNDRNKTRNRIKDASSKIAVAAIIIVILNSKNYKYKSNHETKPQYANEQTVDMPKTNEPQAPLAQITDKVKEEEDRENARKERLRKMAENYTMSGAKLDAIEKKGYYVQGGMTK